MTVRPATPGDAARVGALMEQLGYQVPADDIARRIGRDRCEREVFVAETGAGIVGWVAVCVEEGFVEGRLAWVEGFVVDERARGSGIGARLLATAETWARARGCDAMRVQSNVIRERAHAFYARHGYVKLKTQFAFRKSL
ncbi:MAG: GNAT family N-acetyltransferase [Candidatus Eremiobacteraeota bacterium]|nr:GNAT family N-acetyltransferase [Candidatus Eremiobacteraeota bacterium]